MSGAQRKNDRSSGSSRFSNVPPPESNKKSSQSRPDKSDPKAGTKQQPAYRRWDRSEPLKSTVEEQTSRANAIADIDADEFTPQVFQSKRSNAEDKLSGNQTQKSSDKQLSAALNGPVEGLISHQLLRPSEQERMEQQAKNFSDIRRAMFSQQA